MYSYLFQEIFIKLGYKVIIRFDKDRYIIVNFFGGDRTFKSKKVFYLSSLSLK